ncbi:MAG: hydrophobic protein [Candidatus Dormibacteraeota bacterium]|nr:hydrophobic protein [Candidatus Dormibacteraeota bacterium]
MAIALIALLLLLILFGVGGFALHLLWYILIAAIIIWAIGFLLRSSAGGGHWYRW